MKLPALQVDRSGRYFCTTQEQPFFYLGDTAWMLFHRTTLEEADLYLKDRAAKGFNVIHTVALSELDGLRTPNAHGEYALKDFNPELLNEPYWQYIDRIVGKINEYGMYVGFLPSWGDKWHKGGGDGPEIFTPQNARNYCRNVAQRYRDAGLIWILGGDRAVDNDEHLAIQRAMAEGLREGDGGAHLITWHPPGGRSSSWHMGAEPWIDFHMEQACHNRDDVSRRHYQLDRELFPRRPYVNGEPPYEEHPCAFQGGRLGWLDEHDVRRELYWSIVGGAAGFTYGNHPLWQFYEGNRYLPLNGPRMTWQESLALPGSSQLSPVLRRLADQNMLTDRKTVDYFIGDNEAYRGVDSIGACCNSARSRAWVYLPLARKFRLHRDLIAAPAWQLDWVHPVSGKVLRQNRLEVNVEWPEMTPPPIGDGCRDILLEVMAL